MRILLEQVIWQYSLEQSFVTPWKLLKNISKVHFKKLQNIYPISSKIATFADVSNLCVFCKIGEETLLQLFDQFNQIHSIWDSLNLKNPSTCAALLPNMPDFTIKELLKWPQKWKQCF